MIPRLGSSISVRRSLNDVLTFLQDRLDIMAMTSDLLDQGFQKLTRWCSFEFRQLGRDTQLEVDNVLRETVRRLRLQPELLS